MKKVLLIGDSIRVGYQPRVVELLKGFAIVSGPEDNCRFSAYTLFNLSEWVVDDDYDVIQWNNGQWDTCYMPDGKIHTTLTNYLESQERIATLLLKMTRRLIFATTTPVWPEQYTSNLDYHRRNEDINAYNIAVANLLLELNVEIIDLNGAILPDIKRYISEDMVHLTDDGNELCASLIARAIEGA